MRLGVYHIGKRFYVAYGARVFLYVDYKKFRIKFTNPWKKLGPYKYRITKPEEKSDE